MANTRKWMATGLAILVLAVGGGIGYSHVLGNSWEITKEIGSESGR